jgi:peroxiredoxin Q/BCP
MEYAAGDPAPHFNLRDRDGRPLMLYDYFDKAHVVLVFFGACGEGAAGDLATALQAAVPRFLSAGAEVLGVYPETAAAASAFATEFGLSFPVLADDDRSVSREYGALKGGSEEPAILFLIDLRGDIQLVLKNVDPAACADQLLAALREPPAA